MVTTALDIDFSYLQISETGSGATQLRVQWTPAPFLGLKLPERDVNHSRPHSSEVKNGWIFRVLISP